MRPYSVHWNRVSKPGCYVNTESLRSMGNLNLFSSVDESTVMRFYKMINFHGTALLLSLATLYCIFKMLLEGRVYL